VLGAGEEGLRSNASAAVKTEPAQNERKNLIGKLRESQGARRRTWLHLV
jgi:hypothetical protein